MRVGYARVSTDQQLIDLQVNALKRADCDRLFTDQGVSGASFSRAGLRDALASLSPGDEFVVWRLDRLGRTLTKLVELVDELGRRGVQFVSLTEHIDTRTAGGMLTFHLMAALAQFERALISERTLAGMAEARARGSLIGRPSAMNANQRLEARALLATLSTVEVAQQYGVHPRTLVRILKRTDGVDMV
jgi:DNA invertase Pin-like site-specific DNA recombinase